MLKCRRCGEQNPEDETYCRRCGTSLGLYPGRRCVHCGVLNPHDATKCIQCDAPLDEPDAPGASAGAPAPRYARRLGEADWSNLAGSLERAAQFGRKVDAAEAAPRELSDYRSLPFRLSYLALALAVAAGLLWQAAFGATSASAPTLAAYNRVAALNASSAALLAFDWEPGATDEMETLARPLVAHLMQKRVKLLAVSTLPAGALFAQRLLEELAPGAGYAPGRDYRNLGYLPGDDAAVAALSQRGAYAAVSDFSGGPLLGDDPLLGEFSQRQLLDVVVVFAGDDAAAARWLRQFGGSRRAPLLLATTAAQAPAYQPFVTSGQLVGLLGGLPAAAEYEQLSGSPGRAGRLLPAVTYGEVFMLAGIVALAAAAIVRRTRGAAHAR